MIRSVLAAFALAVMAGSLPANAQSIYKYVYPDGRVVYTDQTVVPGARLDEEMEPPPPISPAEVEARRAERDTLLRAAAQRASSLDQASQQIREWTPKLAAAKAQLEAGREPLPGERLGTYQNKSRLSTAYWTRQKANEEAVWEAEARLKRAQETINATR